MPVYTSILDKAPGQVYGATSRETANDAPALREPAAPKANTPPAFNVKTVATGRLLVNHVGFSIYTWDKDGPNKSNCYNDCLKDWTPVQAPQTATAQGEWGIIERAPGVKQWTYRTKPVYTRVQDRRFRSMEGSDVAGWHNVYTQKNPEPPKGAFTVQDARIGQVLADSTGKSIYVYNCADDALDQLYCDHPDAPQVYRLAICGGNDAARCLATFPYVIAPVGAKSGNLIWGTMWIDPMTGKRAQANAQGALHVWTFRDRPVYTHSGDLKPGDTNADAWGEFNGYRNGFKAFWLRDDFLDNVS
jgi:predicted lipoprotein with Yx(FWY)xxD motif